MFRRDKSEADSATSAPIKEGGKGRPTPTRKEAEAAAKARAKVPRTRKEQQARARMVRSENSNKVRAGMKAGDERYLLPRDKGPVRRFVRDYVDSRFSFLELMIPVLIVTMVLGYSGNETLMSLGNTLLFAIVALILVDILLLRRRVRREVGERFPEEPMKGLHFYALTRAMQMRFMRMPKSQVKIGAELPEHYR